MSCTSIWPAFGTDPYIVLKEKYQNTLQLPNEFKMNLQFNMHLNWENLSLFPYVASGQSEVCLTMALLVKRNQSFIHIWRLFIKKNQKVCGTWLPEKAHGFHHSLIFNLQVHWVYSPCSHWSPSSDMEFPLSHIFLNFSTLTLLTVAVNSIVWMSIH